MTATLSTPMVDDKVKGMTGGKSSSKGAKKSAVKKSIGKMKGGKY